MLRGNKKKVTDKDLKQPQQENSAKNVPDEKIRAAYDQAEEDIQQDADLSLHSPNDDLDEGETGETG